MHIRAIATSALLVLVALCVGGILLLQSVDFISDSSPPDRPRNTSQISRVDVDSPTVAALFAAPAPATMSDPVQVVQEVGPAVVTVINQQQARGGQLLQAGAGTGFIISDQGYIVTNQHVVEGGMSFEVILADGTTREARLIGEDSLADLAVLQIGGPVPATVPLADSNELQQGQRVLAIGSPLGAFTNTVTRGIVSAVNRDFPGAGTYANLVQHDAAINPGNSGGPLLNLAGQVVGVNTLGIQRNADGSPAQGLFFAVPSNQVRQVVAELIANGRVVYPYLGVGYAPLSAQVIAQFDLQADRGVFVTEVERGGPADQANIRPEDVILAVDDRPINAENTFIEVLSAFRPGDDVTLTLQRGDRRIETETTLDERPDGI